MIFFSFSLLLCSAFCGPPNHNSEEPIFNNDAEIISFRQSDTAASMPHLHPGTYQTYHSSGSAFIPLTLSPRVPINSKEINIHSHIRGRWWPTADGLINHFGKRDKVFFGWLYLVSILCIF